MRIFTGSHLTGSTNFFSFEAISQKAGNTLNTNNIAEPDGESIQDIYNTSNLELSFDYGS